MISYLSKPIASTVKPYSDNIELIAKVAQQKQNKYDNVLSTILQKQSQLLNLDLSYAPGETVKEKDNLLKQADDQLNTLASFDLTVPDNINKVENIFTPITSNQDIMLGMGFTKSVKENIAIYDEWRKNGKGEYEAANQAYSLSEASKAKQMTKEQFKNNYNSLDINAIKYRNIDKEYKDAAKELGYNVESVVTASDDSGMYLITKEGKYLKAEDIMGVLPDDSGITAQAKVNAWTSMQNVTAPEILNERVKIYDSKFKDAVKLNDKLGQDNKILDDNITEIKNKTAKGNELLKNLYQKDFPNLDLTTADGRKLILEKLEAEKSQNQTALETNQKSIDTHKEYLNDLKTTYGLQFDSQGKVIGSKDLDENQLTQLKTQYYLESKKMAYAKAYAKESQTIKIEANPYGLVQANFEKSVALEGIKDQYAKENKILDAELDAGAKVKEEDIKLIPAPADETQSPRKYTYEDIQQEIAQTNALVGKDATDVNSGLARTLVKDYITPGSINVGAAQKAFVKDVGDYTNYMKGFDGDLTKPTALDKNITYGDVMKKYPKIKGYLDQRALLQAQVIQKQEFIKDLSGESKNDPKVAAWMQGYQKAEAERLRKIDPQLAQRYVEDLQKSSKALVKTNVNDKLEKYGYGTLTPKLVPRASSNASDPARLLVEDAKNQIFNQIPSLDKSKIEVTNFEYKDGNWVVNYVDKVGVDTQESIPLTSEFISKYANDFNVAAPVEIYKTMVSQYNFHHSGDTWADPSKVITSPPIAINGISWRLVIDESTPQGMVKIGKEGTPVKDFSDAIYPEEAINFMTKGSKGALTVNQQFFSDIREKYLPSHK